MNELRKRGYEGVGTDISPQYSGADDNSAVTKMEYVPIYITNSDEAEFCYKATDLRG